MEQQQLRNNLFQPSPRQLDIWVEVTEIASEIVDLTASELDSPDETALCARLDQAVLQFSLAIIQHPVPRRKFDSVLVSYAAVRFWSPTQGAWCAIGNYTSILYSIVNWCQGLTPILRPLIRSWCVLPLSAAVARTPPYDPQL